MHLQLNYAWFNGSLHEIDCPVADDADPETIFSIGTSADTVKILESRADFAYQFCVRVEFSHAYHVYCRSFRELHEYLIYAAPMIRMVC
jgi:hypothetical protein